VILGSQCFDKDGKSGSGKTLSIQHHLFVQQSHMCGCSVAAAKAKHKGTPLSLRSVRGARVRNSPPQCTGETSLPHSRCSGQAHNSSVSSSDTGRVHQLRNTGLDGYANSMALMVALQICSSTRGDAQFRAIARRATLAPSAEAFPASPAASFAPPLLPG